jgi:hypothetical protein
MSDSSSAGIVTATIYHCTRQFAEVSGNGTMVATVSFDRPGDSAYRVTLVRARGDTVFSSLVPFRPIAISSKMADSILGEHAASAPAPIAALIRKMKLPSTYPPVTQVLVSSDGTFWLASHSNGVTREWTRFSDAGHSVATVLLPENVRMFAATSNQMWGVERDGDGVPNLVSYRLR